MWFLPGGVALHKWLQICFQNNAGLQAMKICVKKWPCVSFHKHESIVLFKNLHDKLEFSEDIEFMSESQPSTKCSWLKISLVSEPDLVISCKINQPFAGPTKKSWAIFICFICWSFLSANLVGLCWGTHRPMLSHSKWVLTPKFDPPVSTIVFFESNSFT